MARILLSGIGGAPRAGTLPVARRDDHRYAEPAGAASRSVANAETAVDLEAGMDCSPRPGLRTCSRCST